MNILCTLTAILSSVSCGEVVIEGGKPYIIGNGILDEIKPIVRLLLPIGFSIIIPGKVCLNNLYNFDQKANVCERRKCLIVTLVCSKF